MGDNLRVDPVDLRMSAGHVDMTADDLRTGHDAAYTTMAEAQGSWVGSSAAALSAKTSQWEAVTARHYTTLVEYGHGLRFAAHAYTRTDTENGSEFDVLANGMGL